MSWSMSLSGFGGGGDHLTAHAPPLRPSRNLNELSSGEAGENVAVLLMNMVTYWRQQEENLSEN